MTEAYKSCPKQVYHPTKVFKLMLKTHNVTGLKYLCITKREDWQGYTGSGKHWRGHLNKHGYDFSTELLFESEDYTEFVEKCRYYSDLWDVVNNEEFANQVPEYGYSCGDGKGNTYWDLWRMNRTEEQKKEQYRKVVETHRKLWAESGHPFRTKFWNNATEEQKEEVKQKQSETMKKHVSDPEEYKARVEHAVVGSKRFREETVYLKDKDNKYATTALKTGTCLKLNALLNLGWEVFEKRPSGKTLKKLGLHYIPLKIRADKMYNERGEFILDLTPSRIHSMVRLAPPAE